MLNFTNMKQTKNDIMKNVILKQESYSYGKCNCCGKKFTRKIRGYVFGFSSGEYFTPTNQFEGDQEKEYHFTNVPDDIQLVKVGHKCSQPIFIKIDNQEKQNINIKPSLATGEYKVHTDNNDFHYIIVDAKGGEMKLNRGEEYLTFKIAQQNYLKRRRKNL